jgi:hypothetical protein
MKNLPLICLCFFVIFSSVHAQPANIDYNKIREYITESEKQWAEATASGDTTAILRILADDFIGVDPKGVQYHKRQEVYNTSVSPRLFKSNHLNKVKIRFYGSMAVAQGDETWVRLSGDPITGRFVWTDTWLLRNGQWQIVAAEDLIAPVK